MTLFHKIQAGLAVALLAISGISVAMLRTSGKAPWTGIVTYVVDGDTVQVRPLEGGRPESIRIDGIDAPEICQVGGAMAREILMQRVLHKKVSIDSMAHDAYGRVIARIDLEGEDQGKWMVANGFAWASRYRKNVSAYTSQQRLAQVSGLGLFSSAVKSLPVYPAVFRKSHGSCYPQPIDPH